MGGMERLRSSVRMRRRRARRVRIVRAPERVPRAKEVLSWIVRVGGRGMDGIVGRRGGRMVRMRGDGAPGMGLGENLLHFSIVLKGVVDVETEALRDAVSWSSTLSCRNGRGIRFSMHCSPHGFVSTKIVCRADHFDFHFLRVYNLHKRHTPLRLLARSTSKQ